MIELAIISGGLLLVLTAHARSVSAERRRWEAERQTLLERIQRPERIPAQTSPEPKEPLETDAPALALVGRIEEDFSPPRKEA